MHQILGEHIIRDWRMADAPIIAKYANNRKIWINLRDGFPHPYRRHDAETFISKAVDNIPPTFFAIATQQEAIGSIGLTTGSDVHRHTAEMGYWLAEPYWGLGIMTQAVQWMTDYAIQELKMHRVFAEPYATNQASARVLEKAGFQREGVLRASVFKDGKILDQHLFSFIANE